MEAAWTKTDVEEFKLDWMPILLRTGKIQFTKYSLQKLLLYKKSFKQY